MRKPLRTSDTLAAAHGMIRELVSFRDRDRAFAPDIEAIRVRVERGDFDALAALY